MSSLIPSGSASGTGSMTLIAPVTNSNQTATLPDATGTVMVSGNMPAFSAYSNSGASISSNTLTKVALDTKEFDTATAFNTSTYRFQPTVAGYYSINALVYLYPTSLTMLIPRVALYKNGSLYKYGNLVNGQTFTEFMGCVNSVISMNGSTDYIELYCAANGTVAYSNGASVTYMNGSLVRTA